MVFGICGNFVEAELVELCLECRVDAASPRSALLLEVTAEPVVLECIDAIVFILAAVEVEFVLEAPEFVVLRMEVNVPEGLSVGPPLSLSPVGGGLGSRRRNHAWRSAALGVILVTGSHSRQRRMKSRNRGSSQPFKAV